MTWAEIVALYRLTLNRPPHNLRPNFNVCPTDPVDVVTEQDGKRNFVRVRWGVVPWWWSKPLKEFARGHVQCAGRDSRDKTILSLRVSRSLIRSRGKINASVFGNWRRRRFLREKKGVALRNAPPAHNVGCT
jgi:putative SOS response-associated peptidase YedK